MWCHFGSSHRWVVWRKAPQTLSQSFMDLVLWSGDVVELSAARSPWSWFPLCGILGGCLAVGWLCGWHCRAWCQRPVCRQHHLSPPRGGPDKEGPGSWAEGWTSAHGLKGKYGGHTEDGCGTDGWGDGGAHGRGAPTKSLTDNRPHPEEIWGQKCSKEASDAVGYGTMAGQMGLRGSEGLRWGGIGRNAGNRSPTHHMAGAYGEGPQVELQAAEIGANGRGGEKDRQRRLRRIERYDRRDQGGNYTSHGCKQGYGNGARHGRQRQPAVEGEPSSLDH